MFSAMENDNLKELDSVDKWQRRKRPANSAIHGESSG